MILHGIEYQRPTSLNMRILADHVTYSFLAFMKSIFHFCLGCYCGGYSQNGRSNLSSYFLTLIWQVAINLPKFKEYVNSLWPSDTIWQHNSGSALAQVMACCPVAPSHYLNEWWLIICKVQYYNMVCSALFLQRALYTVHCTNIMHSRKPSFVITPPVLINTVNRYFVIYAAMKYATFYWNKFICLPMI